MNLLIVLAVLALVPWVAVVVIGLAIVSMAKIADERHAVMMAQPAASDRPCPLCHVEGAALVDPDGVALCTECRCSYEVVAL